MSSTSCEADARTYVPDRWELVRITTPKGEVLTRVLAGWVGGYAGNDEWRLSSLVQHIADKGDVLEFGNSSGSICQCRKSRRGMTPLMFEKYNHWLSILPPDARMEIIEVADWLQQNHDSLTVVSVRQTQHGEEKLVSRSQAKRLLVGIDRFNEVVFDFEGVDSVGQAFADEVFRVFRNHHPNTAIRHVNANGGVAKMISRAMAVTEEPGPAGD